MARRLRSQTSHVVFHTAAWPGDPSAADIDRAHRQQRWAGIGYHKVVRRNGAIEDGEALDRQGAHCRDGGMNAKAVGVCFSGHHGDDYHGERGEPWTPAQKKAGVGLLADLCERYGVPVRNVIGHRETGARKACPGDRVDCNEVRDWVAEELQRRGRSIAPPPVLKRGDRGRDVVLLQRALRDNGGHYDAKIDGDFGPKTEAAVLSFQSASALLADGIVGPSTRRALGL